MTCELNMRPKGKNKMKRMFYDSDFSKETLILCIFGLISLILLSAIISAVPTGPSFLNVTNTSTKASAAAQMVNVSGGYIATINMTVNVQDPKWKAFVGNTTGSFTLSDAVGSTIYSWPTASTTGRIYSTRNGTTINWPSIVCANLTTLGNESLAMILNATTAPTDNLTQTFNCNSASCTLNNGAFFVGQTFIAANTCPSLYTYVNNATQSSFFQEVPLYTAPSLIYETPIQSPAPVGYNGQNWNFQMLVPENGTVGFNSSTAYYLYVELGT